VSLNVPYSSLNTCLDENFSTRAQRWRLKTQTIKIATKNADNHEEVWTDFKNPASVSQLPQLTCGLRLVANGR
jgi:hypothetical protein